MHVLFETTAADAVTAEPRPRRRQAPKSNFLLTPEEKTLGNGRFLLAHTYLFAA